MSIGDRIRKFRMMCGFTMKKLGTALGFTEKTADIRISQYESGDRVPKEELLHRMAAVLNVCPEAIRIPEIDTQVGLLQTLFQLEDLYGLNIKTNGEELILSLSQSLQSKLKIWHSMTVQLENGLISREEYDSWRYNYAPEE